VPVTSRVAADINVYSGIVSLNDDISCFGDVLTTACYVDKFNVFYDDCMFATPLPDIVVCTYIYDCAISPCKALVSSNFKMGDNISILCRIIASCKNVSEFVYLSHVSNFNIARNFPAKAAANLPFIFCTECAAVTFLIVTFQFLELLYMIILILMQYFPVYLRVYLVCSF
jgi:hypothetical protein